MSAARRSTAARALPTPVGKHVMPALEGGPSALEQSVLGPLDADRMNTLGECLFTLNNRRFGPIPGAYVVVQWHLGCAASAGKLDTGSGSDVSAVWASMPSGTRPARSSRPARDAPRRTSR
jgi:hypothetical protein